MIDLEIFDKAMIEEIKEMKKDKERNFKNIPLYTGQIVFIPVIIETHENGKIGCLTHSNIMQTYNKLMREKE